MKVDFANLAAFPKKETVGWELRGKVDQSVLQRDCTAIEHGYLLVSDIDKLLNCARFPISRVVLSIIFVLP